MGIQDRDYFQADQRRRMGEPPEALYDPRPFRRPRQPEVTVASPPPPPVRPVPPRRRLDGFSVLRSLAIWWFALLVVWAVIDFKLRGVPLSVHGVKWWLSLWLR